MSCLEVLVVVELCRRARSASSLPPDCAICGHRIVTEVRARREAVSRRCERGWQPKDECASSTADGTCAQPVLQMFDRLTAR